MAKKNSYWFRHDASAGRGIRIRKIQHIYGHWGKGIYWDVVEILRDQKDYSYPCDESSLSLICSLIGCADIPKFRSWFEDCVKADLLRKNEGIATSESGVNSVNFHCPALVASMTHAERDRANGAMGGRPKPDLFQKNEVISEENPLPNLKANPLPNLKANAHTHTHTHTHTDNYSQSLFLFNNFRTAYPGKKRGNETEFANFKKKHKDWQQVLPTLTAALGRQKESRENRKSRGQFVPEWKNLPTWINQRCWEEEVELPPSKEDKKPEITHKMMFPQVD